MPLGVSQSKQVDPHRFDNSTLGYGFKYFGFYAAAGGAVPRRVSMALAKGQECREFLAQHVEQNPKRSNGIDPKGGKHANGATNTGTDSGDANVVQDAASDQQGA